MWKHKQGFGNYIGKGSVEMNVGDLERKVLNQPLCVGDVEALTKLVLSSTSSDSGAAVRALGSLLSMLPNPSDSSPIMRAKGALVARIVSQESGVPIMKFPLSEGLSGVVGNAEAGLA